MCAKSPLFGANGAGGTADEDGIGENSDEVHEMTSIAVISQHPLRAGAAPTVITSTTTASGGPPMIRRQDGIDGGNDGHIGLNGAGDPEQQGDHIY